MLNITISERFSFQTLDLQRVLQARSACLVRHIVRQERVLQTRSASREFCRRVLRALRDILSQLEFQGVLQPIYTLELLLDLELRLRYFVRFLLRRYYCLLLLIDYC